MIISRNNLAGNISKGGATHIVQMVEDFDEVIFLKSIDYECYLS